MSSTARMGDKIKTLERAGFGYCAEATPTPPPPPPQEQGIVTKAELIIASSHPRTTVEGQLGDSLEAARVKRVPSPDNALLWQITVEVSRIPSWVAAVELFSSHSHYKYAVEVDIQPLAPKTKRPTNVFAEGSIWLQWTPHDTFYQSDSSDRTIQDFLSVTPRTGGCELRVDPAEGSCFRVSATQESQGLLACLVVKVFMTYHPRCSVVDSSSGARFKALLDSGSLSDVVFVVSGEEIPAHSQILGAASDVFLAMFTHDTQDKLTGRVKIKHAKAAAFKEMLRCIYLDAEPECPGEADLLQVLLLADKYQLLNLLEHCKRRVLDTLSLENVCSRLTVVRGCQPLVKKIASSFVKSNFQQVLSSDAWSSLQVGNPALAATVMFTACTSES